MRRRMGRIPPDAIRAILEASPIEEVVREYLPLRPDGRNWKALCPFHSEKTPSFKVNVARRSFHCFGCGEHGNAIDFVMKMDRVEFPEAVRTLARRAGVSVPEEAPGAGSADPERREALYRANEIAARFYEGVLLDAPVGEPARAYLASRGIEGGSIRRFRLGFAPPGWDALLERLREAGVGLDVAERAGLIHRRRSGQGFYDGFRNRIAFPIVDARERVVGFGARALGDEEPKYLNTPETPIFRKGRLLYGLPFAREAALRERHLVIVEGYTDVIFAYQCGFDRAAACLGTALTEANAREIRRYADRVTLVFDADPAGLRAAERSVAVLLGLALDARVLVLPDGQDPCEFLRARGGEAFARLAESAEDGFAFVMERALADAEGEGPARLRRAIARVLETVGRIDDPITRSLLLRRTAERFGIPEPELRRGLRTGRLRPREASRGPAEQAPDPEEVLLELAIGDAELAPRALEAWPPDRFADAELARIARAVGVLLREGELSQRELLARLGAEGDATRAIRIVERFDRRRARSGPGALAEAMELAIGDLQRRELRRRAEEVRSRMREAEVRGDRDASARYLAEYARIQRSLKGPRRVGPGA